MTRQQPDYAFLKLTGIKPAEIPKMHEALAELYRSRLSPQGYELDGYKAPALLDSKLGENGTYTVEIKIPIRKAAGSGDGSGPAYDVPRSVFSALFDSIGIYPETK